ncbi:MAG: hypothetical protein ACUZ8E_01030 [Candidatus Anammoxibacter sp.]
MKVLFATVFLVLLLNYTTFADETNYCHDPEVNLQWEMLVNKYPGDVELSTLHALRMGLCYKVELGDIEIKSATKIFESVRNQLIYKKTKENLKVQKNIKSAL